MSWCAVLTSAGVVFHYISLHAATYISCEVHIYNGRMGGAAWAVKNCHNLHFVAAVGMFISWDNIQSALILMAAAIHLTYHLFNLTILHQPLMFVCYVYIFTILIIYTYFVREFRNFYCILFQDPKFIWQLGSESKSFISPWLGNHKSQLKLTPFH